MSPLPSTQDEEKETGRIEAFSDGVFSIAITLLVLELKVPPLSSITSEAALAQALFDQWPSYLAFSTSFISIFIMWLNHHGLFRMARRADAPFMFANGFLLLLVTVVPFPTALVAEYLTHPGANIACAVYAGTFVLINISYTMLWGTIAYQRRLLKPGIPPAAVQLVTNRLLLGFVLYSLATLVAFWDAYWSIGICFFLWIVWAFLAYDRVNA